ncbi:MAG TPA: tetratricopeptide repeat protein [Candidatus Hydrogenedentes bacterium]|nr:tetratricopeptide repeat protein [Candidatus Hydrogenedentota bacterium]
MQNHSTSFLGELLLRRARGKAGVLMAKAVYETLEPDEQAHLDRLCKAYPALDGEREQYAAFARRFQLPSDELPCNLSSRIDAALTASSRETGQRKATLLAGAAALASLVVASYVGVMLFEDAAAPNGSLARNAVESAAPAAPPMNTDEAELMRVMDSACGLIADSDITNAVTLLEEAVAAHPSSPLAGEALLLLADIEYSYLQRYDRAFDAYSQLRANHPGVFASSVESEMRYGLLAEMRRENYAPLYALDNACARGAGGFAILENLVASYPNTVLASVAVDEMCALVNAAQREAAPPVNMTARLEQVRSRCSNPVAMAQLDLTLGHIYCNTLNDRARAMAHYNRAAASDHVALARQAHEALLRME